MLDPLHLLFDLFAYTAGLITMLYFRRRGRARHPSPVPAGLNGFYFFVLTNGVIIGSVGLGTYNVMAAGLGPALGKSILGALVGGIIAVEMFKRYHDIRGSTAAALVPGLALGIFIGRWGCFVAGMSDFTYGVPSGALPGVDFGDGIARHPVQLYEAFTMLIFGTLAAVALYRERGNWWRHGFYYFAIVYGLQRFVWEFFKPYPTLALGLNIFQFLCLALVGYGVFMLRHSRESADARQVA